MSAAVCMRMLMLSTIGPCNDDSTLRCSRLRFVLASSWVSTY